LVGQGTDPGGQLAQGDIITYKPYPWPSWGRVGDKHGLSIVFNNFTEEEMQRFITPVTIVDGEVFEFEFPDSYETYDFGTAEVEHYEHPFYVDIPSLKEYVLNDLDLEKVEDRSITYQPLQDITINAYIPTQFEAIICKYDNSLNVPGAKNE
jgi:hypothetical protein